QQLGVVVDQKQTSDYYARNQVQSATTVAQSNYAQSNYSDW
ncbi:MAG: hypothetical protein RLZZ69_2435, partial [Cyanobacteriota bacterium]